MDMTVLSELRLCIRYVDSYFCDYHIDTSRFIAGFGQLEIVLFVGLVPELQNEWLFQSSEFDKVPDHLLRFHHLL
ncbi:hypothetical protein SDJN02_08367 [Cucurbita argyrosperma subsp. argyrosperma]|nr:hypothetical protein SDJN02_08367 [Cucurbita argyrosperma subsp. argyrosperma]